MFNKKIGRIFFVIAGVAFLSLSLSGCTTLRKKFIRKKKKSKQSESFIPVLEPIDYPVAIHSSQERYAHHYSLWKVWQRDLIQTIERKESDKRQKYLMAQVLVQLDEMKKWISQEKQQELTKIINNFQRIESEWTKPAAMRNAFSLKKKLELNARRVRNDFNPKGKPDTFFVQ